VKLKRALHVAFGFLTTLPVPPIKDWRDDDLRLAVRAYPVVGLVIGLCLALMMWITRRLEPLLIATLVTVLWLAITGGLHFDGFCDMADAALSPKSVDERWRIAKDPTVGSFALMAGALLILTKVAALTSIVSSFSKNEMYPYTVIMITPILARSAVTWAMARYAVHDSSLLGRKSNLRWDEIFLPVALGLVLALFIAAFRLSSRQALILLVSLSLTTFLLASFLNQKMQGLGGDAYGTIIEMNEAVLLVAANFLM
jgi:adenosylcobinamide-GDP ribazoletransferase